MKRRDILAALLAFGASACPSAARSQASLKLPKLGVLSSGQIQTPEQWNKGRFAMRLRELGWVEGRNLFVLRAYDEGVVTRLPSLAAELVRKHMDVIAAIGPEAAIEAARATKAIPIVFWGVGYPVEQGLIDSYARPGRNVTGVAWAADAQYIAKLLEIVRRISRDAIRVAYFDFVTALRTVDGSKFEGATRELVSAAKGLGFSLRTYPISKREDFDGAFSAIPAFSPQALVTPTTWFSYLEREKIVEFAFRNRLIDAYDTKQFVEEGGLISYGPDNQFLRERTATYVDRILRGARPADLPVEQPTNIELHLNAKTAKARGLTIPQEILVRADGIVE